MAAQRIPAVWSTLRRSTETYSIAARSARAAAFRAYHPSRRRHQENLPQQRYGTANEPPPHIGGGKGLGPPSPKTDGQARAPEPQKVAEGDRRNIENEITTEQEGSDAEEQKRDPATVEGRVASQTTEQMYHGDEPPEEPAHYAHETTTETNKPSDSLLYSTKPPQQQKQDRTQVEEHSEQASHGQSLSVKAPHIDRPRYVHHFDTYSLVKRLVDGGWDEQRAVTIMKAVRLMLADNINLARDALVSKSFLENEAYLFKAACAELKTEVTSRRKGEQEKMRTERTQLQHEVDIISQRLNQETGGLKDDLKGMFDDRKMTIRNEQRDMESKIQQLNYKITVELQADAKSEVEGLRWLMTRRVIITLASVVLMTVGGLKMVSDAYAQEAEEAARKLKIGGGKSEGSKGGGNQSEFAAEETQRRVRPDDMAAREGGNPSYVSLG